MHSLHFVTALRMMIDLSVKISCRSQTILVLIQLCRQWNSWHVSDPAKSLLNTRILFSWNQRGAGDASTLHVINVQTLDSKLHNIDEARHPLKQQNRFLVFWFSSFLICHTKKPSNRERERAINGNTYLLNVYPTIVSRIE